MKKILLFATLALSMNAIAQTTIWTNDFSVPSNWTVTNDVGNSDNWIIGTTPPSGTFPIPAVNSTTKTNGYALFDSDLLCSGNQIGNITTAAPINCSAYSNVLLNFQQYYRRYVDSTFVYVSNNGTTWVKYVTNPTIAVNAYSGTNPTNTSIDISATAGNKSTVYIRFTFYSPSSMGTQAGCGYSWMVDDVSLTAPAPTPPIANFGANSTNPCGPNVNFYDSSSYNPSSWLWNFGDGTNSTLQNPTHTYSSIGTYDVKLLVCNSDGCDSLTKSNYINITSLSCPDVIIGTGASVNSNTSYPAPYGNYWWGSKHQILIRASEFLGAGGGIGYINSLAFNVAVPQGTPLTGFTIKMKSTTANAVTTTFENSGFTTVWGPQTYTETTGWNTHTFTTPFYWDGTSNVIIETCFNNSAYTNNAQMYYTPTSYNSVLVYNADASGVCSNASGSTYTNRPNMKFNMQPATIPPVSNFGANTTLFCNGSGTASFLDSSMYFPTSWFWDFGDGSTSTLQNPTHTYSVTGNYSVKLKSCNSYGCDSIVKTNYIKVVQTALSLNLGNDTSLCNASNVTLNAVNTGAIYNWSTGDSTQSITVNPSTPVTVSVVVTDTNGCSVSDTISLSPVINITSIVTSATCIGCIDGAIDITVTGGTSPYTYLWSNGATTQDISNIGGGNHYVTVTDNYGCSSIENSFVGEPGISYFLKTIDGSISCTLNVKNDFIYDFQQTNDYGYLIAEKQNSGTAIVQCTSLDAFVLIKLDANLNVLWSKEYGNQGSDVELISEIKQISTGFVFLAKDYYDQTFFIKVSINGNILFSKLMPTGIKYTDIILKNNNIFTIGWDTTGYYFSQINSSGNIIWIKKYLYPASPWDKVILINDSDGGFLFYDNYEMVLVKLDSIGNISWSKKLTADWLPIFQTVIETNNAYYFFSGHPDQLAAPGGNLGIFITKIDKIGNFIFQNEYKLSMTAYENTYFSSAIKNDDNTITILGYKDFGIPNGKDILLFKIDSIGNVNWSKIYGGNKNETPVTLNMAVDNGYLIGSSTQSYNSCNEDLLIIKTDVNGINNCNEQNTSLFTTMDTITIINITMTVANNSNSLSSGNICYNNTYNVPNDSNICLSTALPQSICLVTVDSTSTRNKIIWEKPSTGLIDSFYVYREISGLYPKIGAVAYEDLSAYVDTTFGVNPMITSYKYKIAALDAYGNLGPISDFHKTIHLTANLGTSGEINLIWDAYQGFSFGYYKIYRDSTGQGNWQLVDSVSNSNFTWTDWTPPQYSRYFVEAAHPDGCTATKSTVDYNSSRSNVKQSASPGSVKEILSENEILIYPNPNDGTFTIELRTSDFGLPASISIYNVLGEIIHAAKLPTNTANYQLKIPAGIYNVQVVTEKGVMNKKFVVE